MLKIVAKQLCFLSTQLLHLTHIGKLSGSDTGDFSETFSKIYDFKWNLKFRKFG